MSEIFTESLPSPNRYRNKELLRLRIFRRSGSCLTISDFNPGFLAMRASLVAALASLTMLTIAATQSAMAGPFFFSTGNPNGLMASASRTGSVGVSEIETADDFALTSATSLSSATFTGLIPTGSSVLGVAVEIYRLFPLDSDVSRTSGSPLFSTSQVPTRVNSPSDVAFETRDSSSGTLSFSTSVLASSFAANNSVQPGGIHPIPNQTTGGGGPIVGMEVQFNVDFSTLLSLPADHYFFVPLVELDTNVFMWLSASRPIVAPGTVFPAGVTDLQTWTRDDALNPDWLRIGTDIVGGSVPPAFNAAFSLTGTTTTTDVPEPGSLMLVAASLAGLFQLRRRKRT